MPKELVRQRYPQQAPFLAWIKQNAGVLYRKFPDTRRHGVLVVTGTLKTPGCANNCWTIGAKKMEATIGGSVDSAELLLSGSWSSFNSADAWNYYDVRFLDVAVLIVRNRPLYLRFANATP